MWGHPVTVFISLHLQPSVWTVQDVSALWPDFSSRNYWQWQQVASKTTVAYWMAVCFNLWVQEVGPAPWPQACSTRLSKRCGHYLRLKTSSRLPCCSALMHRVPHSGSHQCSVYVTCELLSLSSVIALHSWDKHVTLVTCTGSWIIRPLVFNKPDNLPASTLTSSYLCHVFVSAV